MTRHPEQYELEAPPLYWFGGGARCPNAPHLLRRDFLKATVAGVLVLAFTRSTFAQSGESGGGGARGPQKPHPLPTNLDAWLHLGADGTLTFFTGKVEVGQNVRTSLTQAICEELPAPIESVTAVMGDTDLTPWDQGTFSSVTTPEMGLQLRRVAATAREALLDLAAAKWEVDRSTLRVANGRIEDPASGRSLTFGQLAAGQKLVRAVSPDIVLKPPSAWTVAGTSVPKIDARSFVTGAHKYASDISRPGMQFGRMLRPPAYNATLDTLDSSAAEAMPGVKIVRDGNFVGAVAPTAYDAGLAIAALRATWKTTPQIGESELFTHLRAGAPAPAQGKEVAASGEVSLRRTYTVAYIAHTPLEPRAAVAEWENGKLTVWTGSQRPFGIRDRDLAVAFNLGPERIRVIVPDTGSGYGGKHTGQAAVEAARLAQAAGHPVKVIWSREEEFTWAYLRPAGVIDVSSRVRKDGSLASWEFHNYNSGNAAIEMPYVMKGSAAVTQFHRTQSPLPQGSYRSLAAAANNFARESQIDEMARTLQVDPLAFRKQNLEDPRFLAVIEAAEKVFGWQQNKLPGRGHGVAVGFDKGGYVATFAEVAADAATGQVHAVRVVQAFDCGAIVNPENLKSQLEGAIVQGLGGAFFEAIHFDNGRLLNPHLAAYRVPRFSDAPKITIILVNRVDIPSAGAGETGLVTIAPALGNAIFDASGIRLRSMPMIPNGLSAT